MSSDGLEERMARAERDLQWHRGIGITVGVAVIAAVLGLYGVQESRIREAVEARIEASTAREVATQLAELRADLAGAANDVARIKAEAATLRQDLIAAVEAQAEILTVRRGEVAIPADAKYDGAGRTHLEVAFGWPRYTKPPEALVTISELPKEGTAGGFRVRPHAVTGDGMTVEIWNPSHQQMRFAWMAIGRTNLDAAAAASQPQTD